MKKLTTTAGLVALGAASLQLQAQVFAPPAGSIGAQKPWSVSATLRGFYDDNYATAPASRRRDSFGFEVSPSAGLNIIRETTAVGLSYMYSMRYYEDRTSDKADHSHQINGKLSHAFSPRYKLDATDSFVIAQEPTIIDPAGSGFITAPLRSEGDVLRNTANVSLSIGFTDNTSLVLGYANTYYDYEQRGTASRSALLDRTEHLASVNLRQVILPQTVGIIGYQFGVVDHNSPDLLGFTFVGGVPVAVPADIRDNTSHYFYLGVDQAISSTLNVGVRGGVQYTDYDNDIGLPGVENDSLSPYADANATWNYTEGSYAQIGARHARTQTDVGLIGFSAPTMDAASTTVYGSLSHKITGKLLGSLIAQYQHQSFEGGLADGLSDDLWLAGLNFTYQFNPFLAAEAGYNYDRLDSELHQIGVSRSFTRNRVYVGIRATY